MSTIFVACVTSMCRSGMQIRGEYRVLVGLCRVVDYLSWQRASRELPEEKSWTAGRRIGGGVRHVGMACAGGGWGDQ